MKKKKPSEKSKKRLAIFIDGNNFRHGLLAFVRDDHLHWPTFLGTLQRDYDICKVTYYIGKVTHPLFEKEIVAEQDKLIRNLERAGINTWLGYFTEKKSEKGVDVQIALEIASGAFENEYDVALLISGDGDLIKAIEIAQRYKKRVILGYIAGVRGTSYRISYVLKENADSTVALNDQVKAAHDKWVELATKAGVDLSKKKGKKSTEKKEEKKASKKDSKTKAKDKISQKPSSRQTPHSKLPAPNSKDLLLFCDGASRGNPGHASAGAVITTKDGKIVQKISQYLGKTTNNQAEYQALIIGLNEVAKQKPSSITCYLDSMLVVQQVTGKWKVKHEELMPHVDAIKKFVAQHPMTSFHHIPREKNKLADQLANQALNQRK